MAQEDSPCEASSLPSLLSLGDAQSRHHLFVSVSPFSVLLLFSGCSHHGLSAGAQTRGLFPSPQLLHVL